MPLSPNPTFAITPAPTPQPLVTNYIEIFDFSDTELPDTYTEQVPIYGNRSIASYLRFASAEYASASDKIIWSEDGRLHVIYKDVTRAGNVFTQNDHAFRVRQTVIVSDGLVVEKGIITEITQNTFTVQSYLAAGFSIANAGLTIFVDGSEFQQGTFGMEGALEAAKTIKENKPIIIKDKYEISGSQMTQIGWVEVQGENGQPGYLWYLKSQHETRLRFDDQLEMKMLEAVPAETGSDALTVANAQGSSGLFHEVENNGNVFNGLMSAKADFDSVIKRLDKQGSIMENLFYANRDQNLFIDDFVAAQNSYGLGGTSYGAFDNSEKMALNLGFICFHRGNYEFYKTDWKYLNDPTTRGGITGTGQINGMLTPVGTTSVYDEIMGDNIRMPFLHVKYRETATESRRYKSYVLGSAGGARTNDLDAMEVHYLSERALITLGANNFVLIKN